MAKMTPQEAKRILHPDTKLEAYAEADYYGGFNGAKKWEEAVDEACLVACEALEKQIPKKLIIIGTEKCCPVCKEEICSKGDDGNYGDYCFSCGQALDWSDTE